MYKVPTGTLFLAKNLLIFAECPSTNSLAADLSQSGKAPEGTVVVTHHQTAGRGQRGNTWESGRGLNLTLSVVLQPSFISAARQFQLNKAISLAVRDTISTYTTEPVRVKWPNDIMIGSKKVCGILIENQLSGEKLVRSIVGIGLNVNQQAFESPLASSLSAHSGKPIDLAEVFDQLMLSLERRYLQLRSQETGDRSKELDDDYVRAMFRLDEKHLYIIGNNEVEGIIKGVIAGGRLLVEIENKERSFDLKEIKFVY